MDIKRILAVACLGATLTHVFVTTASAELQQGSFSIEISVRGDTSAVLSWLRPGALLDVYWTGRDSVTKELLTKLIEPSVSVIEAIETSSSTISVTIAATPDQTARLREAQSTGNLTFSLSSGG
jgi:pilus assembly protein CpaB